MGREREEITVRLDRSDHGSPRDIFDLAAAAELHRRIEAIAREPQYAEIVVDIEATARPVTDSEVAEAQQWQKEMDEEDERE